jgi:hypothetical protein
MPLRLAALLAVVVLSSTPADAQARRPTRRIVSRGWPTAAAARPSDVVADSSAVVSAPSDAPAPSPPVADAPPVEAPIARPALHAFGRTGLRVTLPAGWDGPTAQDEGRLPAYALYTFTSAAPGPLAGATLRVEQVTGLNPLDEQRWRVGQTATGYHGTRPVGPAAVPLGALVAFETAGTGTGGGTGGAVAFFQRGRTFWAVSVQAPAALWRARRDDVLALMAGVAVPTDAAAR